MNIGTTDWNALTDAGGLIVAAVSLVVQSVLTFLVVRYAREESRPHDRAKVLLLRSPIDNLFWVVSASTGPALNLVVTASATGSEPEVVLQLPVLAPGDYKQLELNSFSGEVSAAWLDAQQKVGQTALRVI